MDSLDILLCLAVLAPFAMFIVLQIKNARLDHQLTIRRIKKRIGMPEKVLNISSGSKKNPFTLLFDRLGAYILQAGIAEEKIRHIIWVGLGSIIFSFTILTLFDNLRPFAHLIVVVLPFILPVFVLLNIHRRRHLFVRQLPDAIETMVRSLAAGNGIDQAMLLISEDFPQPISGEFRLMTKKIQLGIPFDEVMTSLRQRLSVAEVHYLALVLIIQRETGGQLIKILEQLAALMRRRVVFYGKLKAVTAESRFTAFFIGGLPLAYIGYRYFFNRQSLDFFLHDPIGMIIFKSSLALIFIGIVILKYLTRISF